MSVFGDLYQIGIEHKVVKSTPAEIADWDHDPRGILWIWEPPAARHTYIQAIDPSVGITGWNRYSRVKSDWRTNNGAIEILRIGKGTVANCQCSHCRILCEKNPSAEMPDHQVAEWAGPVDAFEIGEIANIVGRLYAGTDEDQCKTIGEAYPGPGKMTVQRMMELGYMNHWRWERYADGPVEATHSFWWWANQNNNKDLWFKSSRYLCTRGVVIRSPWLVDEYANLRYNPAKEWAENHNGADDRARAMNLAIWCAKGWSVNLERTAEPVTKGAKVDWQGSDMTAEDIYEEWTNRLERLMEG